MVETDATIRISATGGTVAAQECRTASAALTDVERGHGGLRNEMGRGVETRHIRLASQAMASLATGGNLASAGVRGLTMVMRDAAYGMGAYAMPLMLVIMGVSTAIGLWQSWAAAKAKVTKETEAELAAMDKEVARLQQLRDAGVKLSAAENALLDADRQRIQVTGPRLIKLLEDENRASERKILSAQRSLATAKEELRQGDYLNSSVELVTKLTNNLADVRTRETKHMAENLSKIEQTRRQLGGQAQDIDKVREALVNLRKEMGKGFAEDMDKWMVSSGRISKMDADTAQIRRNLDERIAKIHELRGSEKDVQLATADATLKMREAWVTNMAPMKTVSENFFADLIKSADKGAAGVKEAFSSLRDAFINMVAQMVAQKAAAQIFGSIASIMFPVAAVPMLAPLWAQSGGRIPGREGAPVPVIMHGGEEVGSVGGKGRKGASGGSYTQINHYHGGIGGLDHRSQRMISRQQRRLAFSAGGLPTGSN